MKGIISESEPLFFSNIKRTWAALSKLRIFNSYWWKELWYYIDCKICPRNRWAINAIPNYFQDLDTIYLNVLYAGLVSFVEEQDALNFIDWSETKQSRAEEKKIKEIYNWIKIGRPAHLIKIDKSYPKIPEGIDVLKDWINSDKYGNYKQKYGKLEKLENELYKRDTEYLCWLIKWRNILWT